jgi:hypothetical protein
MLRQSKALPLAPRGGEADAWAARRAQRAGRPPRPLARGNPNQDNGRKSRIDFKPDCLSKRNSPRWSDQTKSGPAYTKPV